MVSSISGKRHSDQRQTPSRVDRSGSTALSVLATGEFDLFFSDIVLPGKLSGADLAERAHDLRPRMGVVLATGYPGEELAGRQTRWTVLRKPYGLPELAEAFRKTLAKSGASG